MKTAEEEIEKLSLNLKMNSICKSLLIRILKSRDLEVRKDIMESIGKIPVSEIETPMDMFNRVSEIIIKDSIKLNPKADEGHDWIKRDDNDFEFCRICNVVKRADGKNKPCKGPVKLTLRNKK